MKIDPNFELRNICGENIIISHGKENINFTKIITLNESATFIWNKIADTDFTLDDMVSIICIEYDIANATATAACQAILAEWTKAGIIAN